MSYFHSKKKKKSTPENQILITLVSDYNDLISKIHSFHLENY